MPGYGEQLGDPRLCSFRQMGVYFPILVDYAAQCKCQMPLDVPFWTCVDNLCPHFRLSLSYRFCVYKKKKEEEKRPGREKHI